MSPYQRLINTLHMQLVSKDAKRLTIGLFVPGIMTQHIVVPRIMHALERFEATCPHKRVALHRSFWLPFLDDQERAITEARTYGLAAHHYGAPQAPEGNHLQVARRDLLTFLIPHQGFDVAFVPLDALAIDIAKHSVKATVVVSDMWDELSEVADTVITCPSVHTLFTTNGVEPVTWEETFGQPEPIPGIVAAVRQWSAQAINEDRAQLKCSSNHLVNIHTRALANSTTLDEFRQAVEAEGAYPTPGMLLFAGIDRAQGTPEETREALAIG